MWSDAHALPYLGYDGLKLAEATLPDQGKLIIAYQQENERLQIGKANYYAKVVDYYYSLQKEVNIPRLVVIVKNIKYDNKTIWTPEELSVEMDMNRVATLKDAKKICLESTNYLEEVQNEIKYKYEQ